MQRLSLCSFIIALVFFGVITTNDHSLQAQLFGVPTAGKDSNQFASIAKLAPTNEPLACWIWNRAGELNPKGNPGEQWFADQELQKSLGQLKTAIGKLADQQESETLKQFAQKFGWLLASKAGIAVFESVDMAADSLNATIAIKLDGDAKEVAEFLASAMNEFEIEGESRAGDIVYAFSDTTFPVVVGVQEDHLVLAAGENQWESIASRIVATKKMPAWLKTRLESLPMDRRSQFAFASISSFMKMLPPEAQTDEDYQRISNALDFPGLKSVTLSSGADEISNVSMFQVECRKEGLGAIMDVPVIEKAKIAELPSESVSAIAFRFSPERILKMIDETVPEEFVEGFIEGFAEESGLDPFEDILKHMEGTVQTYQTGSIVAPKQVLIIGIRNEREFGDAFEKINSALEQMSVEIGMEFVEQTKRGKQIFGLTGFGASAYWSLQDSKLYLASNARAIGSHIRKAAKGDLNSVLDTKLGAQVVADSESLQLQGPLFVSHFDLDQVIEVAMPLIQGVMAFIPPEVADVFDFGVKDFPPIESLLGLRPSSSMLFKSESGYVGISRYDSPVPLELTTVALGGVAVGMLLPAVQQVREAARRTQSMNNLRQLALASLNYEAVNRTFPPAYTVDEDGKPLLSWRVALLPYLEEQALYDQFKQDEPWDSDHNIKLLEKMPDVFRNPSSINVGSHTSYAAPFCEGSAIAEEAVRLADITDGTSNTILFVELGESSQIPWTAPRDFDVSKLADLEIDNGHPGVLLFALCDGSTHAISKSAPLEDFLDACKKASGSRINELLNW